MAHALADLWQAVANGWRRRCPRCGEGDLFERRTRIHDVCAVCGLKFLQNQGDAWFFLLIVDRLAFVLPLVAGLYFGLRRWPLGLFLAVAGVVIVLVVVTTRNRYGLCLGLDFWTRRRWGDLAPSASKR